NLHLRRHPPHPRTARNTHPLRRPKHRSHAHPSRRNHYPVPFRATADGYHGCGTRAGIGEVGGSQVDDSDSL
ncbi:MAG: hypothetical protein LQ337_007155, partial [Flavoplaca oasis]